MLNAKLVQNKVVSNTCACLCDQSNFSNLENAEKQKCRHEHGDREWMETLIISP